MNDAGGFINQKLDVINEPGVDPELCADAVLHFCNDLGARICGNHKLAALGSGLEIAYYYVIT